MSEGTSAAGRGTDRTDRSERIASGLERNFEQCNEIVDNMAERFRRSGVGTDQKLLYMARFVRASAQMANALARFEIIKNRGSNTK